ncbi:MAG TPA: hypothetical protein VNU94_00030 [Acidobacteriaceae bacterium]|nr:hypothetical protein [Acidobacteriaceae bacterium]
MKRAAIKFVLILTLLAAAIPAHAVELRVTAKALEHTLLQQLFTGDQNRYYMRGDAKSPCYVYAQDPKVSFKDDRVVVHVKTHARIGTDVGGRCIGVSLNPEADVSVIPDAEGESIGFRDARIEKLSESRELNFLLTPFLSRQLPSAMKVNAADLLRQLLTRSTESTGYMLSLDSLKVQSMIVDSNSLVVDVDGTISVDEAIIPLIP